MLNIGDKVTVIVDANIGYAKGYRGTITAVRDDLCDVVVYEIDGNYEYSEDELELTMGSKAQTEFNSKNGFSDWSKMNSKSLLETEFQNEIPMSIPKSNTESDDSNELQGTYNEIIRLSVTIASLESELLTVYRELHRINKDSQN